MTLNATWNHYIGTLLAELPALAAQVATRGHERSHEALEKSHGPRRQHLLALAHVLRAESSTFADTLAAALRQQVQAGLQELADERADPPATERPRRRQALSLSLVDDQQVERDIGLARTIQLIESSAEWELRELQALCATLRRARSIRPEHNPLQPQMCANALLSALQDTGLGHEARVVALELCAQPLADAMRELCAQHCRLLRRHGVPAQDYRVRTAAPAAPAAPRAEHDGALRGLAARIARGDRRSTEPLPAPTQDSGLPPQLVARLLEQIADQAEMNGSMRALLARLRVPVARAADADTLFSLDHPVWRLVDRIASLSSVNDGRGDGGLLALAKLLEPIVATLEQTERPDTGAFEEALNQVGEATIRLNSARLPPLPEPDIVDIDLTSSPPRNAPVELNAPPTHAVDAVLRRSVAAQLRGTAAPPALRQFLLGPWVIVMAHASARDGVMAHASARDGAQSPRAMRWQNAVGEFIAQAEAASRTREPLPASAALLELAEQGMQSASIPPHQLQSSLVELRCVLLHEPSPEELAPTASRHDDQPSTVPMDMVVTDAQTPAKQDRAAWLAGLMPGDLCRLFIQGRWMNAQLTWRSGNGQFCVFASRHGGRLHSLTRRQLARLRAEGLAATIERGQQVREAVDTLTRDLDADRP